MIDALIYLVNYTRTYITFYVNLLENIVFHQLEDTGMGSNIFYAIFM